MITLVCGPPGSGKTSYVKDHMRWGDLVIDFDYLYSALSFLPTREKPDQLYPYVECARKALYKKIMYGCPVDVWVIMGGARARDREQFPDAKIILLKKSVSECLRNIMKDPERSGEIERYRPMIEKWYRQYDG